MAIADAEDDGISGEASAPPPTPINRSGPPAAIAADVDCELDDAEGGEDNGDDESGNA